MPTIHCPNCRQEWDSGLKNCPACGCRLGAGDPNFVMYMLLAFVGFPGLGFGIWAVTALGKPSEYSKAFLLAVAIFGLGAFAVTFPLALKLKNQGE